MQEYQVKRKGVPVGKVKLNFDGLYCTIHCVMGHTNEILQLVDRCEAGDIPIGICGPLNGGFGIVKKIPAKYMTERRHEFVLLNRKEDNICFFSADEEIPDHILKQPENCRFYVMDNRPGVTIESRTEYNRCCLSE